MSATHLSISSLFSRQRSIKPIVVKQTKFFLLIAVLFLFFCSNESIVADELVLDESLTETQTVGDFNVSTFGASFELDRASQLDEFGEITAGQLYSYFKDHGIESVQEITFCLDVDPTETRTDYALNSIELRIEDLNSARGTRLFSMGDNSLKLPGYESSSLKPEAQIAIKLDFDFMQQFNENSTEKIKFNYIVNGEDASLPMKVSVMAEHTEFPFMRMFLLVSFAVFWVVVFVVLFRITSPKPQNAASAA